MLYTRLKSTMGESSIGSHLHPTAINFVSGICAATAATLLTQPTDVVRTRMQLGIPGTIRGNAVMTLGHVLHSNGPKALLAGDKHRSNGVFRVPLWGILSKVSQVPASCAAEVVARCKQQEHDCRILTCTTADMCSALP